MKALSTHRILALVLGLALMASACGSGDGDQDPTTGGEEPTGDGETTGGEEPTGEDVASTGCTNDTVMQEVAGLAGDERLERLAEIAADEGGSLTLYTTASEEDLAQQIEAFTERFGVEVEFFSGTGTEVLERSVREVQAGRVQADVVEGQNDFFYFLGDEGALARTDSPFAEDLLPEAVPENGLYYGNKSNVLAVMWNSDVVDAADVPERVEDLRDYDGTLGIRFGNEEHLIFTIKYWQEEYGWSEEEGIEVWREILARDNIAAYTSNSPMAEDLHSGEIGMVASLLWFYAPRYQADGSAIEWQPPPEPLVYRPNSLGVMCEAPHPAAGMLYLDWSISREGQELLGEVLGRDVAHKDIRSGARAAGDFESIVAEPSEYLDDLERWQDLFEELVGAPPAD